MCHQNLASSVAGQSDFPSSRNVLVFGVEFLEMTEMTSQEARTFLDWKVREELIVA